MGRRDIEITRPCCIGGVGGVYLESFGSIEQSRCVRFNFFLNFPNAFKHLKPQECPYPLSTHFSRNPILKPAPITLPKKVTAK